MNNILSALNHNQQCLSYLTKENAINGLLRCTSISPAGDLQDGGHRDHDENERGRLDARAEGGQDLLQDG